MKIAAALITKGDEELESIKTCIKSLLGHVDAIYLTVNDSKAPKIEKWVHSTPTVYLSYFDNRLKHGKWTSDFSALRNYNWSQVPDGYDFIYWQDADDVLIKGENLKLVAQWADEKGKDAVFMDYWYGCKFDGKPSPENFVAVELPQVRERLIRPNKIKWKGRLHETPVQIQGVRYENTVYHYEETERPMVVMHLGADLVQSRDSLIQRMERNKELLELQLEDERGRGEADPRTLLYLMKIYIEKEERELWVKTVEMGKEYLLKSGWDEERSLCLVLMSKASSLLGKEEDANKLLFEAVREYEKNPLTYVYLARSFYNLKDYSACLHWLMFGLSMDMDPNSSGMNNILEMKVLSTELLMKYYLNSDKKDVSKAYKASVKLAEYEPSENNLKNRDFLYDINELNEACRNVHKLIIYYENINDIDSIRALCDSLPDSISKQPSIQSLIIRFKKPRVWESNEICYYASFGGNHFERWDDSSLLGGIGGSETAVIRLAQEWTKMGYKVTVYGDPVKEGDHDGVTYLPWYKFNPKDRFNIFIQWRNISLSEKISSKKFIVDLHDVWSDGDYIPRSKFIDKIMVKSEYHRKFGKNLPDKKFTIVSNGI